VTESYANPTQGIVDLDQGGGVVSPLRPALGLLKTNCLAGHIGLEPANPSASYLIGFT
jgi:hypothetical protein